jgi:hypothetical protein
MAEMTAMGEFLGFKGVLQMLHIQAQLCMFWMLEENRMEPTPDSYQDYGVRPLREGDGETLASPDVGETRGSR